MTGGTPEEPRWLTIRVVKVIHDRVLEGFGGLSGVRDEGLLESALGRPQNLFHYGEKVSLCQLAASHCYGIGSRPSHGAEILRVGRPSSPAHPRARRRLP